MPSLYEGMSNAVLEAMACELPVIASSVGGNKDLIRNEKTGYLFNLDNPEAFRCALLSVLKHREQTLMMGKNARKMMIINHDWKRVAENYVAYFTCN
jgi:glycosyltransferase involved in cell wall biosynthesis